MDIVQKSEILSVSHKPSPKPHSVKITTELKIRCFGKLDTIRQFKVKELHVLPS
jgi:hypothetical protein